MADADLGRPYVNIRIRYYSIVQLTPKVANLRDLRNNPKKIHIGAVAR